MTKSTHYICQQCKKPRPKKARCATPECKARYKKVREAWDLANHGKKEGRFRWHTRGKWRGSDHTKEVHHLKKEAEILRKEGEQ